MMEKSAQAPTVHVNETPNGLIQQYFPKSSPLSDADPGKICWAKNRLNNRPRKCKQPKHPMQFLKA
jgi:IS30 family transposase